MLKKLKELIIAVFMHEVESKQEPKDINTLENSYKAWSKAEEEYLIRLFNDGLSYDEISSILDRTESAVYQKVRKLIRNGQIR